MNMFWELLEAIIKYMIVFQELNFDLVKEILKIRCRIYILMKKVIILRKIQVKLKSVASPLEKSKDIHTLAANLLAASSVLWKKVLLKVSQNSQETLVPDEAPMNFGKFLRTNFLQNNSGRLFLKCRHCSNKARYIDCICCRELDAMLIASAKIPDYEGSISPSSFYVWLLVTRNRWVLLFVPGVAEWNKKAG